MGFIAYPAAAEHSDAVPAADAVTNTAFRHVIGNKEDVANETADQASLVGLNRQVLVEAREIKRHHHNWGIGIGPAASASGTDHVADALGATAAPAGVQTSFTLACAANNDWGTEVQIWGATDCATVLATGKQGAFDLHRCLPTGTNSDKQSWLLCLIFDATSAANGLTNGTYTIMPIFVENADKAQHHNTMFTEKSDAGVMVWAKLACTSQAAAKTVDFQFEVHGYPV